MKTKLNNKDIYALGSIILSSAVIMIACVIIRGSIYGSNMDWISQHYPIPEYFRMLFYDTHELFPSYAANLGAGESIYSLSYYGLYSPAVMLSYLLPFVPMAEYMMIASVLTAFASESIFYFFMRKSHDVKVTAFVTALFAFSMPLIFQSHRHIMFVSFMPFLLLAMHFTDRYFESGKRWPLVLCSFLMIMCNYFFAVTALFALAAYGLSKLIDEKLKLRELMARYIPFVMLLFVSVLMSCVLLLPTAYGLLAGRDEGNVQLSVLSFLPDLRFDRLTYESYSMGLTAFGVFACIYGAFYSKGSKRFISVLMLLFAVFPVFVFILNGTLYFDAKVLFSFLPLALIVTAWFIEEITQNGTEKFKIPMYVFLAGSFLCPLINLKYLSAKVYAADAVITAYILYKLMKKHDIKILRAFIAIAVVGCCIKNYTDELIDTDRYSMIENSTVYQLVDDAADGKVARTAIDIRRVDTPNKVYSISEYQDTLYSSIHSKDYNHFYFEVMCNENEFRNSALTTRSQNIFFNSFMGDRYVISDRPLQNYGYELLKETEDSHFLYENKNALPLAYHTDKLMSRREFDSLDYPASVEALTRYTVVEQELPDTGFVPSFEKVDIGDIFDIKDVLARDDTCEKDKDGVTNIRLSDPEKSVTYTKKLPDSCKGKLLFIRFHIDNPKPENTTGADKLGDVAVTINGIKNKLTDPDWKYYNNNKYMEYTISDSKDTLEIMIKGGIFKISELEAYTVEHSAAECFNDNKTPFEFDIDETQGDVISGNITAAEDGYLATSFVYQEGMTAEVDGEKVTPEKVNTAFVGFPVSKGSHKVVITYHAPWLNAGIAASSAGAGIFLIIIVLDIFKRKKDK